MNELHNTPERMVDEWIAWVAYLRMVTVKMWAAARLRPALALARRYEQPSQEEGEQP